MSGKVAATFHGDENTHDLYWTGAFFKCTCGHYLIARDIDDAKQEIQEHWTAERVTDHVIQVSLPESEAIERVSQYILKHYLQNPQGARSSARGILAALRAGS